MGGVVDDDQLVVADERRDLGGRLGQQSFQTGRLVAHDEDHRQEDRKHHR
jgi:hypothetical protein